jgi:hypothetical protein
MEASFFFAIDEQGLFSLKYKIIHIQILATTNKVVFWPSWLVGMTPQQMGHNYLKIECQGININV